MILIENRIKEIIEVITLETCIEYNQDLNDQITRDKIKPKIIEYCHSILNFSNLKVICNETNNSPELIDSTNIAVQVSVANIVLNMTYHDLYKKYKEDYEKNNLMV